MFVHEGCIDLDTPFARQLGFTADRFGGYLWRSGKYIWISAIISWDKGEGHFSELLKKIETAGFGIKVPDPSPTMKAILKTKGFRKTIDRQQGPFRHYTVERTVMIKKPSKITVARIQGREKMRGETRGFEERECNPIILRPLSLGHIKSTRPI